MIDERVRWIAERALSPYLGRCTACPRTFRADLPYSLPRLSGPSVVIDLCGCDCRNGKRCPEGEHGFPACGDWECAGHDVTQKFAAIWSDHPGYPGKNGTKENAR